MQLGVSVCRRAARCCRIQEANAAGCNRMKRKLQDATRNWERNRMKHDTEKATGCNKIHRKQQDVTGCRESNRMPQYAEKATECKKGNKVQRKQNDATGCNRMHRMQRKQQGTEKAAGCRESNKM
jgi:hypothetical protein